MATRYASYQNQELHALGNKVQTQTMNLFPTNPTATVAGSSLSPNEP